MSSKQIQRETLDEFYRFLGLVIFSLLAFAVVNLIAFGLLGYLADSITVRLFILALAWTAIGSFAAGYKLGAVQSTRHITGVQTGLDLKVAAQQRQPAVAPIGVKPAPPAAPAFTAHNPAPEVFDVAVPKSINEDW